MIPNSNNTDPIYVERQPDWSQAVLLSVGHQTLIFTARAGLEQRSRQRATPVYRISYVERGLLPSQYAQRQARAAVEVISPLWVPFWTERVRLTHDMTATTVQIDQDPRPEWFAVGQLIYVGGQFRTIETVAGRTLTITAGAFTAWPAGTKAYPARLCRRMQGEDIQARKSLRAYEEHLIFETID